MTDTPTGPTTGEDFQTMPMVLLRHCTDDARRAKRTCPGCSADLMRVGIPELAYVFDPCDCGSDQARGADRKPFTHLAEQLWHRHCLETVNG